LKVSEYCIDVEIVTFYKKDIVKCRNGLIIIPHRVIEDFDKCEVLMVPGGRDFVINAMNDQRLLSAIRKLHGQERLVASVYTGFLILVKAGVLKGKKATTHHLKDGYATRVGGYTCSSMSCCER